MATDLDIDPKISNDFAKAIRKLDKIAWDYKWKIIWKAQGAIAGVARKAAKRTTAFRDHTGRLRKSIGLKRDKQRERYLLRARAAHSHLLELGTKRMPPRPFLVSAAMSSLDGGLTKATKLIVRELKKYETSKR